MELRSTVLHGNATALPIDGFRAAGRPDAGAIAGLVNRAYRPQSPPFGWTHEAGLVAGERTAAAQLVELIGMPDSLIVVGLRQGELVACAHLRRRGDTCAIGMLAVSPAAQARGAGKAMLAEAEAVARAQLGAGQLTLAVLLARTALIDFYLRRAYRRTGRFSDYPRSAGAGLPIAAGLQVEVLEKPAGEVG